MKIEDTNSLKNKIEKRYIYNKESYIFNEKIYKYYEILLNKISDTFYNLDLNNHIEIADLYLILLWHGVFSVDHTFNYRRYDRYDNLYLSGMNVMIGEASCINTAGLLKDILTMLGYESYILACRLDDSNIEEIDDKEVPSIPTTKEYLLDIKSKILKTPNHAVTGVVYDGRVDIIDSINKDYANIYYPNNIKYLLRKRKGKLDQHETILINQDMNKRDLKRVFIDSTKSYEILDRKRVLETHKDMLTLYRENLDYFNSFYRNIEEDIMKIDDEYHRLKLKYYKK